VFYTQQPSDEAVSRFIASQRKLPFSYAEVGATKHDPPPGYNVDHNRIKLGDGELTFQKAVAALGSWKHFDLGWVKIVPDDVAIEVGNMVAVRAQVFGLWTLNACRIVYVLDEKEESCKARFGFAYGTLPAHAERGEERFSIEWHQDDSVWYDIYAFSRPQHPLVRFVSPYARVLQKRFARASIARMAHESG
jgi:uncharacterized protein (UPF0548 family)